MGNPTAKRRVRKPSKSHTIFARSDGRWGVKVDGKARIVGRWGFREGDKVVPVEDVEASRVEARREYERCLPYWRSGETPPAIDVGEGCTMRLLCNTFLTVKQNRLNSGELSQRSYLDYKLTTDGLIDHFGRSKLVEKLTPDDFERYRSKLAKSMGLVRLRNEINRCRVVFKFARDQKLISGPVTYGQSFARPSAATLRKKRNADGVKLFEPEQLRLMLAALNGDKVTVGGKEMQFEADPVLRAMLLLATNCGYGNSDLASLPISAIDLSGGWVTFPRGKTGAFRRAKLWPETADAIRDALAVRPEPKEAGADKLAFLTRFGVPWVRLKITKDEEGKDKATPIDALSQRFARFMKSVGIETRDGIGLYTARHCTQTAGSNAKDDTALRVVMGHTDPSISSAYLERVDDHRIEAVCDAIRRWVFG